MSVLREEPVAAPIRIVGAPVEDAAIESAVRSAIALHGPSLLFDTGHLRELLQRDVGGNSRQIRLLLAAQAFEVPQQLLGAHTGQDVASTIATLATRLVRALDMAMADAHWAVASWARILGVVGEPATAVVPVVGSAPESIATISLPVGGERAPIERMRTSTETAPSKTALSRARPPILIAVVAVLIFALLLWFNFSRPSLVIAEITSAGKLVADGAANDITVAFKAHRAAVRGVEVRTVGSASEEAPRTFEVAPEASASGKVTAGTIALQSEQPRKVTYRYVLVGEDGARSPPFEKTFEFAAGPPRPPNITGITVPPDLIAGKPFALGIAYEPGSRGIAQVEMRVASSTIPWTSEVVAMPWVIPASGAPDAMRYPFEAGLRPSHTTLDFTMIDQDGVRSEPRRVALEVREPRRVALDVRKPTGLAGCTRTTCGRIVTTREIEPSQGLVGFFRRIFAKDDRRERKVYEVVVKRDDGTMHVLNDTTRWSAGARVRIRGNRVSLRCLEAADRCT